MKRPQGPVPTLAELQKSVDWFWLWCERCQHSTPIKFAPLIQRSRRQDVKRSARPALACPAGGIRVCARSITSLAQVLWNWLDDPAGRNGGQLQGLCFAQAFIVAALGDWIVRCRCGRQTSEEQREHQDVAHLVPPNFASLSRSTGRAHQQAVHFRGLQLERLDGSL